MHEGFLHSQRLAYQCAKAIRREMQVGWTEKQTADLMETFLRDHGIRSFFHTPFAWFGDRTRFDGIHHYWGFMPSERRLLERDVVILDCAPIREGYVGDIGYTFSLVENPDLEKLKMDLRIFRKRLPELFASDRSRSEIWKEVDQTLREKGYDNCHAQYPFGVLGHRVRKSPFWKLPGITVPFSWQASWMLLSRAIRPELLGPDSEGTKEGLWAIEPHLGADGFGGKFEEILVVQNGEAYWLDEEDQIG